MNIDGIKNFLRMLGISQFSVNGNWVSVSCPLARLTHEKGTDSRPSFGISVNARGRSVCKCFTCMSKIQPLEYIPYIIWRRTGRSNKKLLQFLAEYESDSVSTTAIELNESYDPWNTEEKKIPLFPKKVLDIFPLIEEYDTERTRKLLEYLSGRGISKEIVYHYGVRFSRRRTGQIVFPFTDLRGNIQALRVRVIAEKRMFTVNEKVSGINEPFPKLSETGAMFGLHLIDQTKPVMIVEGEIDHSRLVMLGFKNVVACGGTSITQKQVDNIWSYLVYSGFDSDRAGIQAAERFKYMAKNRFEIERLNWSKVGCKDPGELKNKMQLRRVLSQGILR